MFISNEGSPFTVILVYGDDIIITGNNATLIIILKKNSYSCFHLKTLGTLKSFMGIKVARSKQGIYLPQCKYALDSLHDIGNLSSQPCDFSMEQNLKLKANAGLSLSDSSWYCCLIGCLINLIITRSDTICSINILRQFMSQFRESHWQAAFRVVRYIKRILLSSASPLKLHAPCDFAWASCPTTR